MAPAVSPRQLLSVLSRAAHGPRGRPPSPRGCRAGCGLVFLEDALLSSQLLKQSCPPRFAYRLQEGRGQQPQGVGGPPDLWTHPLLSCCPRSGQGSGLLSSLDLAKAGWMLGAWAQLAAGTWGLVRRHTCHMWGFRAPAGGALGVLGHRSAPCGLPGSDRPTRTGKPGAALTPTFPVGRSQATLGEA